MANVFDLGDDEKTVLVVLFIPSVDRDGIPVDQDTWVNLALKMFGNVFGGATAFPQGKGVWRDDERRGNLVFDNPVIFHCYTSVEQIENPNNIAELKKFCCLLGEKTNQGEVGLVIDNSFLAIRDFSSEVKT